LWSSFAFLFQVYADEDLSARRFEGKEPEDLSKMGWISDRLKLSSPMKAILRKEQEFLVYGIPTWLIATIQVGLAFITLIFAGKLGQEMLAGVGLGNTMYNVLLWSVLWGFTSALDTFGPQVFACAERKEELGTVTLKIALQGLLVFVFILGPYLNSTHLVLLLPTDVHSSNTTLLSNPLELAVTYMRLVCIVPLLDFFFSLISKYLTIQRYIVEVYVISLAMIILHVLWNLLLVRD